MRVFASVCLVLGCLMIGCDTNQTAAPAGSSGASYTNDTTGERDVHIDAAGAQVDVDVDGDPADGSRRRIRLPNVDVNIDRTPGGAADVDVNVERRDDASP